MKKSTKSTKKKKPALAARKRLAQQWFNKYIRLKYQERNGKWICRACGKETDKVHAGHLFGTRNYNWLRFDEDNVRPECPGCNTFNHEHLIWYSESLRKELGLTGFNELLKKARNRQPDWKPAEIEEIIQIYKQRVKEYETRESPQTP